MKEKTANFKTEADSKVSIQNAITSITASITRRRLDGDPEAARKDFAALGVDSVNVFEIILALESKYPVTLGDDFLFAHRTPEAAAEALLVVLGAQEICSQGEDRE